MVIHILHISIGHVYNKHIPINTYKYLFLQPVAGNPWDRPSLPPQQYTNPVGWTLALHKCPICCICTLCMGYVYMGVSKNRGKTPKMDGL